MRKLMFFLFAFASTLTMQAQTLEVIAVTGDTIPGTIDVITQVGDDPVLNENGQVALDVTVTTGGGNFANVLLRGESSTPLVVISRSGDAPPQGNGTLQSFSDQVLADDGTLVFKASVEISGVAGTKRAHLRGDGTNPLVQIAREGDLSPTGEPIDRFKTAPAQINALGRTVFGVVLDLEDGGSTSDEDVIYSRAGNGPLVEVLREGDTAPNAKTFGHFDEVVQNNVNQLAFASDFTDGIEGIFRVDGDGSIVQIAQEGQAAPDGNGSFSIFDGPILNENGVVAFHARVNGAVNGATRGIFRGDGSNPLEQIIRSGVVSPDGLGTISSLEPPAFNNTGQVAFRGGIDLGNGGTTIDDDFVMIAGGGNPPVLLARENTPVLSCTNPNLIFSFVEEAAINDMGQVAFDAGTLDETTGVFGSGVFFYDPLQGLLEVVTLGTPLLGSTVQRVEFSPGMNASSYGNDRNGINNLGQVTFQFVLADGRFGVALWTIDPDGDDGQPIPIPITGGQGSVSSSLDTATDTDTFTFTLSATSDITLSSTGDLDTRGVLRNGAKILLNDPDLDDNAGVNSNFLTSARLSPGDYEITVCGHGDDEGDYQLALEAQVVSTLPPAAENALLKSQTARQIKKLNEQFKKAKKSGNSSKALKFKKKIKKLKKLLKSL